MIPRNVIITRSWIVSTRARSVYLICIIFVFAMVVGLVGIRSILVFGAAQGKHSFMIRALEFLIVLPGMVATAMIWVAMWYHWYGYNKDSFFSKAFWFLALFYLGPIAALVYYFFPYRWNFTGDAPACESSRS